MIRKKILKYLYQLKPFNLKGDLALPLKPEIKNLISCLICSARTADVLNNLLEDLKHQKLDKKHIEIIVLDNSPDGLKEQLDDLNPALNIKYLRNTSKNGFISDLRNETLEEAQGEYILFLDDDTRITQSSFLQEALSLFNEHKTDIILPHAQALSSEGNPLDPYSFATRCCIYRRSVLEQLGGFHKGMRAYEDIDLGIRTAFLNIDTLKTDRVNYTHPELRFDTLQKPLAIGQSILRIRSYYPFHIWLLIYSNALRFLVLIFIPTTANRQWFKLSLGVLLAPFVHKTYSYRP